MIRATISPVPEDLPGDIDAVQVGKGNAKTTGIEIQGVPFAAQSTRRQNLKKGRGRPKKRVVGCYSAG
jgi:hypothetical protein